MSRLYYLAYGSNLHPLRLSKRVPSAALIGITELEDTRVVFHKRSRDGSAKCMILKEQTDNPVAYGALFAINADEQKFLDEAEGCGYGYSRVPVQCTVEEIHFSAFTYVAETKAIDISLKPYHWYKNLVIAGARYHQFPETYISIFEQVSSIQDPDNNRRKSKESLLHEINRF